MAAAKYGALQFRGLSTGRKYNVSIYCNDVTANNVRFDAGNGVTTTSPFYWKAPDEAVMLEGMSLVNGLTDIETIYFTCNGSPVADSHVDHLSYTYTYTGRPYLGIPFPAGADVGAIQQSDA